MQPISTNENLKAEKQQEHWNVDNYVGRCSDIRTKLFLSKMLTTDKELCP